MKLAVAKASMRNIIYLQYTEEEMSVKEKQFEIEHGACNVKACSEAGGCSKARPRGLHRGP